MKSLDYAYNQGLFSNDDVNDMSTLAHRLEDIFYVIREDMEMSYDFTVLIDLILESIDYFKIELMKVKKWGEPRW